MEKHEQMSKRSINAASSIRKTIRSFTRTKTGFEETTVPRSELNKCYGRDEAARRRRNDREAARTKTAFEFVEDEAENNDR